MFLTPWILHWIVFSWVTQVKFENLLLQVLGFAAFFALVLKKVDQEEFGEPQIDENFRNSGTFVYSFIPSFSFPHCFTWQKHINMKFFPIDDPDAVRIARRDSTCSFYQPPPPTDIEKLRSNMIKEQKVFALIREILGKVTIMRHSGSRRQHDRVWNAGVKNLFAMQPTLALCGCCFWWHMVRGTPMLIFWPNTFDKASAKASQTPWVFRMWSAGLTQLCWPTCSESTQVSVLWWY